MGKSKLKKLTAANSSKQGTLVLNNPTGNISFSISGEPVSQGETWVINETPSFIPPSPFDPFDYTYTINFVSNGTNYSKIRLWSFIERAQTYKYIIYGDNNYAYVMGEPMSDGWTDQAYRTVTFATVPTGDLLTWLQANAVKQ